jgi:hypothetical protein
MRVHTDADFNADSRELSVKLEIYFNETTPLVVSKDDFLIDANWLEEGSAESSNPFGAVSSNELSFRLYNENGMFSPTNPSGPYFGHIKANVRVVLFIRVEDYIEEVEWLQLGEYFVTSWDAAITGTYADVVANDKWQQIFSSPTPNYPVRRDSTFYNAFTEVYGLMGFDVLVNSSLTNSLLFSFIEGSPLSFTQELVTGALAFCTCNKAGVPIIEPFIAERSVRATLTDANQIKIVSATQSINKTYDGVELAYFIPQGIEQEKLVDLQSIAAPAGIFQLKNIAFSNGPLWQLTSIGIQSNAVSLVDYSATPWLITLSLNNTGDAGLAAVNAYGQVVGFTKVVLTDDVVKLLKVKNRYIQTAAYAARYKEILDAFVTSTTPTLNVSIRGNPLLDIGDRVNIQSLKHQLNYSGVIQRMDYQYTGGLSCEMTLLNADLLQGVL